MIVKSPALERFALFFFSPSEKEEDFICKQCGYVKKKKKIFVQVEETMKQQSEGEKWCLFLNILNKYI